MTDVDPHLRGHRPLQIFEDRCRRNDDRIEALEAPSRTGPTEFGRRDQLDEFAFRVELRDVKRHRPRARSRYAERDRTQQNRVALER